MLLLCIVCARAQRWLCPADERDVHVRVQSTACMFCCNWMCLCVHGAGGVCVCVCVSGVSGWIGVWSAPAGVHAWCSALRCHGLMVCAMCRRSSASSDSLLSPSRLVAKRKKKEDGRRRRRWTKSFMCGQFV